MALCFKNIFFVFQVSVETCKMKGELPEKVLRDIDMEEDIC